jgi:hypothetical protein
VPHDLVGIAFAANEKLARLRREDDGLMPEREELPGEGIDDDFLAAHFGKRGIGIQADSHTRHPERRCDLRDCLISNVRENDQERIYGTCGKSESRRTLERFPSLSASEGRAAGKRRPSLALRLGRTVFARNLPIRIVS